MRTLLLHLHLFDAGPRYRLQEQLKLEIEIRFSKYNKASCKTPPRNKKMERFASLARGSLARFFEEEDE